MVLNLQLNTTKLICFTLMCPLVYVFSPSLG